MSSLIHGRGAFAVRNARLFVYFRMLYNARAYYPILAVFFTDLGLTLDQFVMLNFIWAAAIFLLEVPSGALADTVGRKRLLVFASAAMVAEMSLLLFAPKNGGWILLGVCALNRLLSGASEAAASGADEALAYDSLPEANRAAAWEEVLGATMRWQSVGFLIAMSLGGLLYDPAWINRFLPASLAIPTDVAHRLPVAVVLLQALSCLVITMRMTESRKSPAAPFRETCASSLRLILGTAGRAFTTRTIALVLVGGVLVDAFVRNFATLTSGYYRMIQIPDRWFGLIGSLVAVVNWFVPAVAKRVNQDTSPLGALSLAAFASIAGLAALAPAWPWFGILPAALLMAVLGFVSYTLSAFLNRHAASEDRATLLSVKGLVFNLGYGTWSMIFSLIVAGFRVRSGEAAFQNALLWQPVWFAAIVIPYFLIACRYGREKRIDPA
jgi:MFS family permease